MREALRAARPLERVHLQRGAGGPRLQEIVELCRAASIPVRFEDRSALDRLAREVTHQGVVAIAAATAYVDFSGLVSRATMLVILDGVEDPHNLGAIVRTAHAAGAGGVVVGERRAAGLGGAAAKAAAGALAYLPVARVVNISRCLRELKQRGFWIYGLDERGDRSYDEVEYVSPTALVLGGEGHGLHLQVRRQCDYLVNIPLAGRISSLNVSVACGIALFEWKRRSRSAG